MNRQSPENFLKNDFDDKQEKWSVLKIFPLYQFKNNQV